MKYCDIETSIRSYKNAEFKFCVKDLIVKELYKCDDIAFWLKQDSAGNIGFFIVYEVARGSNMWLWWCPSENQIKVLQDQLSPLYKAMEILKDLRANKGVK
jgi:hypothetical protein